MERKILLKKIANYLVSENLPFIRIILDEDSLVLFQKFTSSSLLILHKDSVWKKHMLVCEEQNKLLMDKEEFILFYDCFALIYCMKKIYLDKKIIGFAIFGGYRLTESHYHENFHHSSYDEQLNLLESMSHKKLKKKFSDLSFKIEKIIDDSYEIFTKMSRFLRATLPKKYTINSLERKFLLDAKKINTIFKNHADMTFFRFQQALLMDWAVIQLEQKTFSAEEISERLGYSDTTSFRRALRKYKKENKSLCSK